MGKNAATEQAKLEARERDQQFADDYRRMVERGEKPSSIARHFGFASVESLSDRRNRK